MKELQDLITNQMTKMAESGELAQMVRDGVTRMVSNAIEQQFRSYGDLSKQLDEVFQKGLKVDESKLDFPSMNAMFEQTVNGAIADFYKGQAAERLQELVAERVAPLPAEMTVGELAQMIVNSWRGDEPRYGERAEYTYEESSHGWWTLKIWETGRNTSFGRENSPDINIHFNTRKDILGSHGLGSDVCFMNEAVSLVLRAYGQGVKFTDLETAHDSLEDVDWNLWEDY